MPQPFTPDPVAIAAVELLRQIEHTAPSLGRPICPACGEYKPAHTDLCPLAALLDNHGQHAKFMQATNGATVLEVLTTQAREREALACKFEWVGPSNGLLVYRCVTHDKRLTLQPDQSLPTTCAATGA